MATLALPLAILDAEGTASSIARFTDGNATAPKSLKTLGDTEFGAGTQNIANWDGLTDVKEVKSENFIITCNCGSPGPVYTCDCIVVNPAMVVGDRFDANMCLCAYSSDPLAYGAVRINCNSSEVFFCCGVSLTSWNGLYTIQNIDNNDLIEIELNACSQAGNSAQGCAYFCIVSVTDQQQSSFCVASTSISNLVFSFAT